MLILRYENKEIKISNPDKYLWPELKITKLDYINHLIQLSPFILKYTKDRPLTVIRYPDGIHGKSFFQKHLPSYTPKWVNYFEINEKKYIHLDNLPTLVWLGSQGALEFHVTFNTIHHPDRPSAIVFDLDPSEGQHFNDVVHAALLIKDTLQQLNIQCFPKTSGASGAQIYIPIGNQYTYDEARDINYFFGSYFSSKYPQYFTIERSVNKRGKRIYFDYLQMWHKKTIIAAYSPRAVDDASVSTPVHWHELEKGIMPRDFNLLNIADRLEKTGDFFSSVNSVETSQNLSFILANISK